MTQKDYYDFREDENTRQVSLERLLRCAFKRWKLILLAGIILGGLFGSYKILSIHSKKKAMISAYDSYKSSMDVYNASASNFRKTMEELKADISSRVEYIQNSPVMQIDPYNSAVSSVQFRVATPENSPMTPGTIYSLIYAIYDEIYYGDTCAIVAQRQNMEPKYLNELLFVRVYSNTGGTTGESMSVVVHAADEATAESIRDDLIEVILSKKDSFSNFGEFELEVYDKGTTSLMDTEIQAYQEKQTDSLAKKQTALYTAQTQSAALVRPASVPQYSKKYMLKNGIKLGIVGLVGGAALALLAVISLILYKGAVLTTDEIDGEYGLRTLADFSGGKSDDGSKLDYMVARIEKCTAGKGSRNIGIVGSVPAKMLDSLAAKLNEKAGSNDDGLQFVSVPELLGNAQSYRKLSEMDAVILTEEIGRSNYMGIRKEIAMLAENNKEILGTVYY